MNISELYQPIIFSVKSGHNADDHNNGVVDDLFLSLYAAHPCDQPKRGGCQHICRKNGDKAVCACKVKDARMQGFACVRRCSSMNYEGLRVM